MRNLDFLPPGYHQARHRRRQRRRHLVYVAGVFGALLALHLANSTRLRSATASLASLRGGDEQFHRVEELTAKAKDLRRELSIVGLLDDDAPVDALLAEQVRLMGESMVLRWLRIERLNADGSVQAGTPKSNAGRTGQGGDAWLLNQGVTRAKLGGMASNDVEVGTFLGKLAASPLFSDVTLVYSRQHEENGRLMREFELHFTVNRVQEF